MIIRLDYDNDQILIDSKEISERSITFRSIDVGVFRPIICEIINMVCDGDNHPNISIEQQDEGQVTGIEEY